MEKKKKILIAISVVLLLVLFIDFLIINWYKNDIFNENEINKSYDIGLVLGCLVHEDGTVSNMLKDRLNTAISLYASGKIEKILVSGNGKAKYSETKGMYEYLKNNSVKEEDILIDEDGLSTGRSIENYSKNYKDKSVLIISQKYHLYRALYIADRFDLNATGVHALLVNYRGQVFREIREILARNKDYVKYLFQ